MKTRPRKARGEASATDMNKDDPLDLSPQQLFDRGIITPGRYLGWQTPRARETVRWMMQNYGHELGEALDELWYYGGL